MRAPAADPRPPGSVTSIMRDVARLVRTTVYGVRLYAGAYRIYTQGFFLQLLSFPMQMIAVWYLWKSAVSTGVIATENPTDASSIVAYYATVFLLVRIANLARVSWQVEDDIHRGNLMVYLSRPVWHWQVLLSSTLARILVGLAICCPLLLILVIFVLKHPITVPALVGFLVAGTLGSLLEFLLYYGVGLSAFWVERVWGIMLSVQFVISLLGGRLLPLDYYPAWLVNSLAYTPFQFIAYEPVRLFLAQPTWQQIPGVLIPQLIWLVIISAGLLVMWKVGIRRFAGQGA